MRRSIRVGFLFVLLALAIVAWMGVVVSHNPVEEPGPLPPAAVVISV